MDEQRTGIKGGELANPDLTEKCLLKWCVLRVSSNPVQLNRFPEDFSETF